jgi:hypothetical protein
VAPPSRQEREAPAASRPHALRCSAQWVGDGALGRPGGSRSRTNAGGGVELEGAAALAMAPLPWGLRVQEKAAAAVMLRLQIHSLRVAGRPHSKAAAPLLALYGCSCWVSCASILRMQS